MSIRQHPPSSILALLGLLGSAVLLAVASSSSASGDGESTEQLLEMLRRQGISSERVIGTDSQGIPLVDGQPVIGAGVPGPAVRAAVTALPAGTRSWEGIPGVIRNDGADSFRLEVDTNGPVVSVILDAVPAQLVPPQTPPVQLRDDGSGGDQTAGDFVFTSGPFRYNPSFTISDFYANDPTSPAGLDIARVGAISIEELDHSLTSFLIGPEIGVLRSDILPTPTSVLSSNVVVSPHLINIRTSTQASQLFLRFRNSGDLTPLTAEIYAVLPDAFDFLMFFSTDKVERLPTGFGRNFVAGTHLQVQTNYTGTGLFPFNDSAAFGSDGRLLGSNVLDAYNRGLFSKVATHELLHQWSSFISPSLGLSDGAHYSNWSSAASLVGGFRWIDNGDGTFTRDCDEGPNGAHHAAPLDKYMMGLVDATGVGPLHAPNVPTVPLSCGELLDDYLTVTIQDIQGLHGNRSPGPADAQREFAMAFVAESHNRLLNPTEMTFYDILAEHYAKLITPENPDPYISFNWAPITRFFGEGTNWRTSVSDSFLCSGSLPTIVGTAGGEVISGTTGNDVIHGLGGDDRIRGRGGADVICGGDGDDDLGGQGGNDVLLGDAGNDSLVGGPGEDAMDGGAQFDSCNGGPPVVGDTASNCETVTKVP